MATPTYDRYKALKTLSETPISALGVAITINGVLLDASLQTLLTGMMRQALPQQFAEAMKTLLPAVKAELTVEIKAAEDLAEALRATRQGL